MKNIFIFTFLLFSIASFAQKKYKTVKHQLSLTHKEIYQIEKKSKIKDGFYYIIQNQTKDTLVSGVYKDNKKNGIWKYYNKNAKPYLEYDYNNNLLVNYHSTSNNDSTYIKNNDTYILDRVDNPQLYIGYKNEAVSNLAVSLIIPRKIMDAGKSGISIYSFIIDKDGILEDIKTEQSIEKEFDTHVIQEIKKLNNNWVPARKNGKAVASKTFLIVEINNNSSQFLQNKQEVPYIFHLGMMYSGSYTKLHRL